MLSKTFFLFLLQLIFISMFAQKSNTENRFDGYIVYSDGTKKEGILEVEDASLPWSFQENVKYFDKSLLSAGRVKREQKINCVPGEIIEYGFDNRKFTYVSYYIKSADEDNILKSTYSKIKGDKNTDFFAEVFRNGKISLLKFYIPPVISEEDYDNEVKMKELTEKSKTTFDILITREGEKPKSIDDINIKSFFKDCPYIVEKFNNGKYKIKPGKSLKAIFKSEKMPREKLQDSATEILTDYETKCNG